MGSERNPVSSAHTPLLIRSLFCTPGAEGLRVEFDRQCSTERRHDPLTVMDGVNRIVSVRSGKKRTEGATEQWASQLPLLCLLSLSHLFNPS